MGTPRIRNGVRKVAGFSVRQVTGSILGNKLARQSALQPRLGSLEASSRSAVQIDVVHDSFGPEWIVARATADELCRNVASLDSNAVTHQPGACAAE